MKEDVDLRRLYGVPEVLAMESVKPKPGQKIAYDDGRPGHRGVLAEVLSVSDTTMVVQFEDRADTTTIAFSDRGWMDHLRVKHDMR